MIYYLNVKLGIVLVEIEAQKLVRCVFMDKKIGEIHSQFNRDSFSCVVNDQLNEYFHHQRFIFALDLFIAPKTTEFQRKVWDLIIQVPYGETCSYKEIAIELGKPNASRAVGQAVAANPFHIVIPCHRVISTGGEIGGYAGGVFVKKQLLAHESKKRSDSQALSHFM